MYAIHSPITIFKAKTILTMDFNFPEAEYVAVAEGKILALGGDELLAYFPDAKREYRFAENILMPGLVEAHAHMMNGFIWKYSYIGFQERIDPGGKIWHGLSEIEEVLARLKAKDKMLAAGSPLIAWGFDPIFLAGKRLTCRDLDDVSRDRPIVVYHSNFHLMTVNSKVLEVVGFTEKSDLQGLQRFSDGQLNGELHEMAVMFPIDRRYKIGLFNVSQEKNAIRDYAKTAVNAGVTTATDLFNDLSSDDLRCLQSVCNEPGYPLRLMPMLNALQDTPQNIAKRSLECKDASTEKLILGAVKIITEGSIQGYSARVKWPSYVNGRENGIWNIAPKRLQELMVELNRVGIQAHIHVNGDEASEVAIEAVKFALNKHPRFDHRHTLQHCQMADRAQFLKMRNLGLGVNLFANHIYYFGDQHRDVTIGPDKARRMNAFRTALDLGIPLAIHSDAPVTPLGPLFTAWCAVTRETYSGKTLGSKQCLSVDEALHAITLGAAYSLHMDDKVGSIEIGKYADFAVLNKHPKSVSALRDSKVLATVLGGTIHMC